LNNDVVSRILNYGRNSCEARKCTAIDGVAAGVAVVDQVVVYIRGHIQIVELSPSCPLRPLLIQILIAQCVLGHSDGVRDSAFIGRIGKR
jgi:hypothetical protein